MRDPQQAPLFPEGTKIRVGDPTDAGVLADALDGVTGIVFTQGTYRDADAEQVNYRRVLAVLRALNAPAGIALMTALGVTRPSSGHDWKRRGERLVRASGLPYTIVRPGWFDDNEPDKQRLVMLQATGGGPAPRRARVSDRRPRRRPREVLTDRTTLRREGTAWISTLGLPLLGRI